MNFRLPLFLNTISAIAIDAEDVRKVLGIQSLRTPCLKKQFGAKEVKVLVIKVE